jgi:hypothetical protein
MSSSEDAQVDKLLASVTAHSSKSKGKYLADCISATSLLLTWISHLRTSISREVCDRLLDAAQATAIEAAGCVSLGLVRPAIFSIRSQLELILAWIYFNDHPVEWRQVENIREDYPMRASNLKYMRSYSARFQERFALLAKSKVRKNEDPYGLLSIHVHSTAVAAAPAIGDLASLVKPNNICEECIELQKEVAEYLTDVLAAWYAGHWHDFPDEIKAHLKKRLTTKLLPEFCK